MNVVIRKVMEKDADDWAFILHKSYEDIYHDHVSLDYMKENYSVERLKNEFLQDIKKNNEEIESYILILEGVSVGVLKIGKPINYYTDGNNYYRDDIDGIGEIKSLHIKHEYQGKGIGSEAISFAENRLKQLNYKISSIWVKIKNVKAINFYIDKGYQKTNYINPNTNDKLPSMVMEKIF